MKEPLSFFMLVLFIDYVIVDRRTIQAEGGEAFIVNGYQAGQLNWSGTSPGRETLYSLGALRFVVGAGAFAGGYDANGNLIYRLVDGAAHTLTYDAENRLVEVKRGSTVVASYVYDYSGFRVKQTLDGTTTAFVGTYYEIGSEVTKYYFAAGVRVALRSNSQGVKYLLGDHLGSTSITATVGGTFTRQLYTAWGEVRYSSGTLPTQYTYTGQYAWASLGILYYNARNYDPSLGRFLSADTVVPNAGVPGDYDRYAYVENAPTMMVDPSGHMYLPGETMSRPSKWVLTTDIKPAAALVKLGRYGLNNNPYGPAQYIDVEGEKHNNLCGHFAFASIYESVKGGDSFDYLYGLLPTGTDEPSELNDWARIINDLPGWSASYKSFSSGSKAYNEFKQVMEQGAYIMILCVINTLTGELVDAPGVGEEIGEDEAYHWVSVKAINSSEIQIYNPYTNTYQSPTWQQFNNSRGGALVIYYNQLIDYWESRPNWYKKID